MNIVLSLYNLRILYIYCAKAFFDIGIIIKKKKYQNIIGVDTNFYQQFNLFEKIIKKTMKYESQFLSLISIHFHRDKGSLYDRKI